MSAVSLAAGPARVSLLGGVQSALEHPPSASASLHMSEAMIIWDSRDSPRSCAIADSRFLLSALGACITFPIVVLWREKGDL